ncbi:hypothetical protein BJ997_004026 [Cryobacterium roopkundense]|uniref:Uncharacterized protein n=1 Tax=Cryobacterium roopkundense TaxID=1001240 RepID=A0A7W9E5N4_9MICO|nr:hypothetical protein [Cryobacterium roopkundense]
MNPGPRNAGPLNAATGPADTVTVDRRAAAELSYMRPA